MIDFRERSKNMGDMQKYLEVSRRLLTLTGCPELKRITAPGLLLLLISAFLVLSACNSGSTAETDSTAPDEIYVWSHNDYEHPRPLFDALGQGFQMIEVDIHLIDGELYVAHDPPDPADTPTLEELYLKPLDELISEQNGVVQPGSTLPFYLVIDVKTEAVPTYEAIREILESYQHLFTRMENDRRTAGAVTLLISGNRPSPDLLESDRIAFLDGRIPDLGEGISTDIYPVISDNWNNHFTWRGTGEIPQAERQKLDTFISSAHNEGKLIRFWGTPDTEEVWEVLYDAGVDIFNVDDHQGMRDYLDRKISNP